MRRVVVCDTGPILHLHEAGALHLLELTGDVALPLGVDDELTHWIPEWTAQRPAWLSVVGEEPRSTDWRGWYDAGLLDLGEAQAVALARQLRAEWFLTDDTAARLVAARLGFEVHGSLGVVLWAAATQGLTAHQAERALEGVLGSSLWVSARVRAEARAALTALLADPHSG